MRIQSIVFVSSLLLLTACFGDESSSSSFEIEPNDDVLHATDVVSGDEISVEGTCRDANDRDYFRVTAAPGTFKSSLRWTEGAFEIGFTPESGLTDSTPITSAISPIEVESTVSGAFQTSVIFVVDCNPAGSALPQNLDYRVVANVPQ